MHSFTAKLKDQRGSRRPRGKMIVDGSETESAHTLNQKQESMNMDALRVDIDLDSLGASDDEEDSPKEMRCAVLLT